MVHYITTNIIWKLLWHLQRLRGLGTELRSFTLHLARLDLTLDSLCAVTLRLGDGRRLTGKVGKMWGKCGENVGKRVRNWWKNMENVGKTRKNDGNMLRNSWKIPRHWWWTCVLFGVFWWKHWGRVDTVDDFRWNKRWKLMICWEKQWNTLEKLRFNKR